MMVARFTGVLLGLPLTILLGTAAVQPAAQARVKAPAPVRPLAVQDTSRNWAGYVVRQNNLNKITAHFRVPAVDCAHMPPEAKKFSNAAIWIGLDGGLPPGQNTSIEQVGVDANCSDADPEYQAWWEMEGPNADDGAHLLSKTTFPVEPGDFIKAAVTWNTGSTFTFTLVNYADATPETGAPKWTFTTQASLSVQPKLSSAEAIVERPVDVNVALLLCLSNFATVDFQRVKINTVPLRDFDATSTAFTLLQDTGANPPPNNVLATPGPVSQHASDAFTVTWHNYGTPRSP
jgi:hypothetical protein